ncbi:MAG: ribonuclease III [Firmicutes bacterium]|nr:ribonuclease III [Bacillota bacterium]
MEVYEKFNIIPNHKSLYVQAFTHTSYANENGLKSYERLEYLGDAVLELVMSEYLFKNTEYEEGKMTKLRSHYVCESALYEYSTRLNLNDYILLGHGEEQSGGRSRKAIVADIFEAFIGAMFLDQGLDFVKDFIYKNIIPLIERKEVDFFSDYKSILQELVQTDRRSLEYTIINEDGPAHDKTFTVEVKIDNIVYGTGTAHSKKQAEQEAAKDALKKAQNGN